jgi:hypothetical protein
VNYSLETTMLEVHLLSVIMCTYFKACFNTGNEKKIRLWQKSGIKKVGMNNCCLSRFS